MITICIAARNEEKHIIDCLQAIKRLSFPTEQLEVLIGNDASEDSTATLVSHFIQNKPNYRLINITQNIGQARGKANVLAQLALQAKGVYLFFTDADVQIPSQWIQTMLSTCEAEVGIITGTTLVAGDKLFSKLQSIDWIYGQGLIKMVSYLNFPVTAMGNNMMVTKVAYRATGGYENMPFSITEDYALFKEIVNKGFAFKHLVQPQVLAFTQPILTLKDLLQQRKRWMRGAFELPRYYVALLLLQALFVPMIIPLFLFFPIQALTLWLLKIMLQSTIVVWMLFKLKQYRLMAYIPFYEPYYVFISLAGLIYYFAPGKLQWKGRYYFS